MVVVFSFFPEKSSNIRRQQKLPPVAVIYKPMTESAVMFKTTNKTQNSKASSYCWKSSFSHQKRFVGFFFKMSFKMYMYYIKNLLFICTKKVQKWP